MSTVRADYVITGAGAMGMAFADTLLTETSASMVIVDRYHQPGGHWTLAYPFVRLHQPSSFYGVNSRALGDGQIDQSGLNRGLSELASGAEVCGYFNAVMQQQFLPSGRVRYLPMTEMLPDGTARSLITGAIVKPTARIRHVDARYMGVTVPSMRPPPFPVADGVRCVAINALATLQDHHPHYTIVGAGKTGIDACLWLLHNGLPADRIRWIMPRDSWYLDRALLQPEAAFMAAVLEGLSAQGRAFAAATGVDDLFDRLESSGQLLRLDATVRPTMYKCATVTRLELDALRAIRDVARLGHVRSIDEDGLTLEGGRLAAPADTLYVDCTANGLLRRPPVPIFSDHRITLQSVRGCQQVFSAAFIAHVEAAFADDAVRNDLCRPVPHPDSDLDYIRIARDNHRNETRWADDLGLQRWLAGARLQLFRHLMQVPEADAVVDVEAMAAARVDRVAVARMTAQRFSALLNDPDAPAFPRAPDSPPVA
ncbi:MAG: NAD(P)/FAD-dependent oxidoreductase [Gammaproteobacteria bacterium]